MKASHLFDKLHKQTSARRRRMRDVNYMRQLVGDSAPSLAVHICRVCRDANCLYKRSLREFLFSSISDVNAGAHCKVHKAQKANHLATLKLQRRGNLGNVVANFQSRL